MADPNPGIIREMVTHNNKERLMAHNGEWTKPLCPKIRLITQESGCTHLPIVDSGISISGKREPRQHAAAMAARCVIWTFGPSYNMIPIESPHAAPKARCCFPLMIFLQPSYHQNFPSPWCSSFYRACCLWATG